MKALESKRKLAKNLSLVVAIGLTLCSCTTTKLIHVDVGCEGQPDISLNFTEEEANRFTDEMDLKLSTFAITLRERINTQCRINEKHDKKHNQK